MAGAGSALTFGVSAVGYSTGLGCFLLFIHSTDGLAIVCIRLSYMTPQEWLSVYFSWGINLFYCFVIIPLLMEVE